MKVSYYRGAVNTSAGKRRHTRGARGGGQSRRSLPLVRIIGFCDSNRLLYCGSLMCITGEALGIERLQLSAWLSPCQGRTSRRSAAHARSDVLEDDVLHGRRGKGGRPKEGGREGWNGWKEEGQDGGVQRKEEGRDGMGGRRRDRRGEVGVRKNKKVNKEEGNPSGGSGNDGRVGFSCT